MDLNTTVTDTYDGTGTGKEFEVAAGMDFSIDIGPLGISLGMSGGYTDNVDDAKDEITLSWEISGKVGL